MADPQGNIVITPEPDCPECGTPLDEGEDPTWNDYTTVQGTLVCIGCDITMEASYVLTELRRIDP